MHWKEWQPFYQEIVEQFSFSIEQDREAARVLDSLLNGKERCDEGCLSAAIADTVTVCGDADRLLTDLERYGTEGTLVCADGATSKVLSLGLLPDLIVTDLDGRPEDQVFASEEGAVTVVHAHGDNIPALRKFVPRLKGQVAGSAQSGDQGAVKCYGGFTDGDRAVILARHFGAKRIRLLGFDFDQPAAKSGREPSRKKAKLAWARRLIFDLNPASVELWTP